ncbi:MAG TPA: type I DNA topoisomerase, partial [Gemmataceae bacterium]|nr:type I DNA topoisomerase [Gemmataceae bacterium]
MAARKNSPTKAVTKAPAGRKKSPPKRAAATAVAKAAPRRRSGGGGGYDLVIVESPAKAKTINKYLGSNFRVLASYGHVRDLPRRRRPGEVIAGVDLKGWVPTYVVEDKDDRSKGGKGGFRRKTSKQILAELKKEAAKAEHVYLATDPDREGEAIAWHIEDELKLDDARTYRIAFNEITRSAVQQALSQPGKIDPNLVSAQEARRILDRVVGYPLSNLLGQKVTRGLSAGRVQSVAVRLIVEREREIEAFKAEEYWKLIALLAPQGTVNLERKPFAVVYAKKKGTPAADGQEDGQVAKPPAAPAEGTYRAELAEWNGTKFAAAAEDQVRGIVEALDTAIYSVRKIEQKDQAQRPAGPFTTSTLQQQASLRLHYSASRTMQTAQKLYEGVELGGEGQVGLITYMRTDSTRISNDALLAVRGHIQSHYGDRYLPAKPNHYASGKSAQEAHEAIRPTDVAVTPQRAHQLGLHGDQLRLYTLIYNRFVASQMSPAIFAVTNVEVEARNADRVGVFKAQGRILKFDGHLRVLPGHKREDSLLPHLEEGQPQDRLELSGSQHFTEPPPRYNEASLVKALEKEGIGRPSTYASIISTIQNRGYVEQKDRRFYATEIGMTVTDLLVQHFPNVMDVKFTSHFEEELDDIAAGRMGHAAVLDEFWGPFSQALETAKTGMGALKGQETGEMCPRCGKPLVQQFSRTTKGKFFGCSGFRDDPPCKYIKPREGEPERPEPVETEHKCPTCGKPMILRWGRKGQFLGCSGYPECKTTMNLSAEGTPVLSSKPTEHKCEKCGSPMVLRDGKRGPFLGCSGYPKCRNIVDVDAHGNPIRPVKTDIKCEKCGSAMIVKKGPRGPFLACSGYPKCRSYKPLPAELKGTPEVKALIDAQSAKRSSAPQIEVAETCPECDSAMKLRSGRGGSYFLG